MLGPDKPPLPCRPHGQAGPAAQDMARRGQECQPAPARQSRARSLGAPAQRLYCQSAAQRHGSVVCAGPRQQVNWQKNTCHLKQL